MAILNGAATLSSTGSLHALGRLYSVLECPMTLDGYIYGQNATALTAHDTSSVHSNNETYWRTGERYAGGTYYIFRSFIRLDTSDIPDTALITRVRFAAYCYQDDTSEEITSTIKQFDWDAYDDGWTGSYREQLYDGIHDATVDAEWFDSSELSAPQWVYSDDLDPTWVNKTGNTFYGIHTVEDANHNWPSTGRRATFYSMEQGDPYIPFLEVTYYAGTVIPVQCVLSSSATCVGDATVIAGGVTHWAAASVSSTATCEAVAGAVLQGQSALAGAGGCSGTAFLSKYVSASLSSTATCEAAGHVVRSVTTTLTSVATCSGTATVGAILWAATTVSSSATCEASGQVSRFVSTSLSATSTTEGFGGILTLGASVADAEASLQATASIIRYVHSTQASVATLGAVGGAVYACKASLSSNTDTSSIPLLVLYSLAALNSSATCSATATVTGEALMAQASLSSAATAGATGYVAHYAATTMASSSTLDAWSYLGGDEQVVLAFSAHGVGECEGTATKVGGETHWAEAVLASTATAQASAGIVTGAQVTLAATATCSPTGLRVAYGTSELASTSAVQAVATRLTFGAIEATATSTCDAAPTMVWAGAASMASTATCEATGEVGGILSGECSMSATATLASVGQSVLAGASVAQAVGACTALPLVIRWADSAVQSAATCTAIASVGGELWGSCALSSTASLVGVGQGVLAGASGMQAEGACTSLALVIRWVSTDVSSAATVTAQGLRVQSVQATLASATGLDAAALIVRWVASAVQSTATCTAIATAGGEKWGQCTLSSVATLDAIGEATLCGQSMLASSATVESQAGLMFQVTWIGSGIGTCQATGSITRFVTTALSSVCGFTSTGAMTRWAWGGLPSTAQCVGSPIARYQAEALCSALSNLSAYSTTLESVYYPSPLDATGIGSRNRMVLPSGNRAEDGDGANEAETASGVDATDIGSHNRVDL